MDYDSCLLECCKSCSRAHQNYSPSTASRGIKRIKSRNLCRKGKVQLKTDKSRRTADVQCGCLARHSEGNLLRKPGSEGNVKNHRPLWEPYTNNEWKLKMSHCMYAEKGEGITPSAFRKTFTKGINEMEEKVNFLFDLFKNCHHKNPAEGNQEHIQTTVPEISFGEVWQIFNLNKRMCAAESGIEKLTVLLKEVLNEIITKNNSQYESDDFSSTLLCIDSISPRKKIAALQSRNDFLVSLMKCFIEAGSFEDNNAKLPLMATENISSHATTENIIGERHLPDVVKEEEITTVNYMRGQINKIHRKKAPKFLGATENHIVKEANEGNFEGNTLDVISEQAEYILVNEKLSSDGERTSSQENYAISPRCKDSSSKNCEKDLHEIDLTATTSRLLAQEALLKSSLEKVHYQLLSNLDSTGKNYLKSTSLVGKQINRSSAKGGTELPVGLFGSSINERKNEIKIIHKDSSQVSRKFSKLSDFKDAFRNSRERNGLLTLKHLESKTSRKTNKKIEPDKKGCLQKLVVSKNSCCSLRLSEKSYRPGHLPSEIPTRKLKIEPKSDNLVRPSTAPVSSQKSSDPRKTPLRKAVVKPPTATERSKKGICGNVKNDNKNLINRKFLVQTS